MRLGVTFPQNELSGDRDALWRFATAVESLGYDHLLIYDHVVGAVRGVDRDPPLPARTYDEKDPFHDPFVTFGFVAAITSRIELITGILILPQRQTVLVARQAADVAILSGGRLRLGVGVGYNPVEYHALGADWKARGRRMDEQVPYLRRLWTGGPITFNGDFDQIDQAAVFPPPAEPIPIWFGGSSEVAFRRAARIGDGFIFGYGMSDAAITAWERVQALLHDAGRPVEGFRALFNLLPEDHGAPGDTMAAQLAALPRLRAAGASDAALTSARCGLTTVDEHIEFITEAKARAQEVS